MKLEVGKPYLPGWASLPARAGYDRLFAGKAIRKFADALIAGAFRIALSASWILVALGILGDLIHRLIQPGPGGYVNL